MASRESIETSRNFLTRSLQIRLGAAASSDEIASTREWRVAFQVVVEQASLSPFMDWGKGI